MFGDEVTKSLGRHSVIQITHGQSALSSVTRQSDIFMAQNTILIGTRISHELEKGRWKFAKVVKYSLPKRQRFQHISQYR